MDWPWVSRARFDDARQQIAELKKANADLLVLALSKSNSSSMNQEESDEDQKPQKAHRKLGVDLRREFRVAAEARAAAARVEKGAK
jgi:hypothetical protein